MPDSSSQRIRPIAICVFRSDDHLFVLEGYDEFKPETFYRPLGGGIEFWETGRDAVTREIREEIGTEVDGLKAVGSLENIFVYGGERLHEIVLTFEGRFVDSAMYNLNRVITGNEEGTPFKALWVPIAAFRSGDRILYPTGLLELLDKPA